MDEKDERDKEAERRKTIERLNAGVDERLAILEKAARETEAMVTRILESYRTNRLCAEAQRPKP